MGNVELLMEKVSNAIPYDTDDWQWNEDETVIQFVLLYDDWEPSDPYCFAYDEEDVFERTIEQQMDDWIEDKFLY